MNVSEIAQNTGGLDSSTFTHGGARQFDFCDVFMNVSEITQNTGGARQFDFQILADGKSTIFTNGAQVSLKNNNS